MARLRIGAANTLVTIAAFLGTKQGVMGSFVEGGVKIETINHNEVAPPCAKFPTLMWGGRESYFRQKNGYESRSIGNDEAADSMHSLVDGDERPEVAVVVVLPPHFHEHASELSLGAFPSLSQAISTSPSSKVFPCVTRSNAQPITKAYTTRQAGESQAVQVSHDEIVNFLQSTDLLSNGKMDVIVTSLPSHFQAHKYDDLVQEISSTLQSVVPDGRYIMVQAPEFHASHPLAPPRARFTRRILQEVPTDDSYYPKTYLYATPNLVAGMLTGAFMIATVYLGAQVLLSLQGPSKFIHGKLPEGKEF